MQPLDMDKWPRREAYELFSRFSNPFFMVTFRQEVTALYRYTKARGLSFYKGLIWACTAAINRTDAFLMAKSEGQLARLNRRDPSFTDLHPSAAQFHIVTLPAMEEIDSFCREAERISRGQQGFLDMNQESDALIYFTCLPWVELTALTNERDFSAPDALDDSVPRIAWGKYTEEGGRKFLHISMEVNHRFVDGLHIGQFAAELTRLMEALPEESAQRGTPSLLR